MNKIWILPAAGLLLAIAAKADPQYGCYGMGSTGTMGLTWIAAMAIIIALVFWAVYALINIGKSGTK